MLSSLYNQAAFSFLFFTCHQGASSTVISAIVSFIYLMTINPEIQIVAQREIDSVIENNSLPTFDDRASLPYVEAIYRELLRFAPPLPLSIPHSTNEDDHYKGYFIPKGNLRASFMLWPIDIYESHAGTNVYPNIWWPAPNVPHP